MTETARFFDRELRLATRDLEPDALRRELAAFARQSLAEVIASGDASPRYRRFVNQREGESEDAVILPGPIIYEFQYLEEIVTFALEAARELSPVLSGRYKRSWFALINGTQQWIDGTIPIDATVLVTNDQPYHRKIHVLGSKGGFRVPPGIVERVRQQARRLYRDIATFEVRFIPLAGGYRLRRPRRKEAEMTYPALEIRLR